MNVLNPTLLTSMCTANSLGALLHLLHLSSCEYIMQKTIKWEPGEAGDQVYKQSLPNGHMGGFG